MIVFLVCLFGGDSEIWNLNGGRSTVVFTWCFWNKEFTNEEFRISNEECYEYFNTSMNMNIYASDVGR